MAASFHFKTIPLIQRKRLYFDVETSFNIGWFWKAGYKINIPYQNILTEAAIICICYKWEGEKKVHYLHWDKKHSDKRMLQDFIKIANEADELIGHNGDKFDLAWIRTRCLFHQISMPPKFITIDTLKVVRSKFRLNSNRLDYIADYLGIGRKKKTESDLWVKIALYSDQKALDYMIKYCQHDVVLLEKVYQRLAPHIEPKINYPALYEDDRSGCPECGSDNLKANGTRATLTGIIKRQYHCRDCGRYHYKTIHRSKRA